MKIIRESVQRIPELKEALGSSVEEFLQGEEGEEKLRQAVKTILQRGQDEKEAMAKLVKDLAKRCKEEGDKALSITGESADKGLAEVFVMLNDVSLLHLVRAFVRMLMLAYRTTRVMLVLSFALSL